MRRHVRAGFFVICVLSLAASPATRPTTRSATTPDLVLRSKGLRLVSHYFLLDDDINLAESMRAMKAAQHKVDDYTHQQATIENDIDSANAKIADLQVQNTNMTDELERMGKSAWASYNRLVEQINAVREQIRKGNQYVAQRQKDLAALDDPSDQYNAAVSKCNASMDAIAQRYAVLAADTEVTAAIGTINKTAAPKVQLGPSVQFNEQRPIVQKLVKSTSEATVPFVTAGGVPQVPVTINDKLKLVMVVDSGAAEVTLTFETAKQLGLKPSSKDKVIHLRAADGKTIDAHVKVLKSIRLGPFVIENVECAIQSPQVKNADNLLGDTFLKRFIYRMDLNAGVLHLSQRAETVDATPPPEAQQTIEIVLAQWGSTDMSDDVTEKVKKLLAENKPFKPSSILFGHDPDEGAKKLLRITLKQDGQTHVLTFNGRQTVRAGDLQ